MKVPFIRFNPNIPAYQNKRPGSDIGYDLYAVLNDVPDAFETADPNDPSKTIRAVKFEPYEIKTIPANIATALPEAMTTLVEREVNGVRTLQRITLIPWGLVTGRSGMNSQGWLVYPGVIDAGYRGQYRVIIQNHTDQVRFIEEGTRIAQLLFLFGWMPELEEVDKLDETDRGDKGFGSSGR